MTHWTDADLAEYESRQRAQGRGAVPIALDPRVPVVVIPARSKYGNVLTEVDGIIWKSKLEARHYQQLRFFEEAGLVQRFVWQVPLEIEGGTHRVDWRVWLPGGKQIWADSKGRDHPAGRKARRQVFERHGIEIALWLKDVVL